MIQDTLLIEHSETLEEIITVIDSIQNEPYLEQLTDDDFRIKYAKKLYENGFVINAKLNGEILACTTGYANNHAKKMAYISCLVIKSRTLGLKAVMSAIPLLEYTMTFLLNEGMKSMRMEIGKDNWKSRSFAEKLGAQMDTETDTTVYYEVELSIVLDRINTIKNIKSEIPK